MDCTMKDSDYDSLRIALNEAKNTIEHLKCEVDVLKKISQNEHQKMLEAELALHMAKFDHNNEMNRLKMKMQRDYEAHIELLREVHLLRDHVRRENTAKKNKEE